MDPLGMMFAGLLPLLMGPLGDEIKERYVTPGVRKVFDSIEALTRKSSAEEGGPSQDEERVTQFVEENRDEVYEVVEKALSVDRLAVLLVVYLGIYETAKAYGAPSGSQSGSGCLALAGSFLSPSQVTVFDARADSRMAVLGDWALKPQRIERFNGPAYVDFGSPEEDGYARMWVLDSPDVDAASTLATDLNARLQDRDTRPIVGLVGNWLRRMQSEDAAGITVRQVSLVEIDKVVFYDEAKVLDDVRMENVDGLVALAGSLSALNVSEHERLEAEGNSLRVILGDHGRPRPETQTPRPR